MTRKIKYILILFSMSFTNLNCSSQLELKDVKFKYLEFTYINSSSDSIFLIDFGLFTAEKVEGEYFIPKWGIEKTKNTFQFFGQLSVLDFHLINISEYILIPGNSEFTFKFYPAIGIKDRIRIKRRNIQMKYFLLNDNVVIEVDQLYPPFKI